MKLNAAWKILELMLNSSHSLARGEVLGYLYFNIPDTSKSAVLLMWVVTQTPRSRKTNRQRDEGLISGKLIPL